MNAQQLHDALTGIPEEMLAPLETIRKKRAFPWKAVSATAAACLVLCAGLLFFPAQEKSGAAAPESAYNQSPQADLEYPRVDPDQTDSPEEEKEEDETTDE